MIISYNIYDVTFMMSLLWCFILNLQTLHQNKKDCFIKPQSKKLNKTKEQLSEIILQNLIKEIIRNNKKYKTNKNKIWTEQSGFTWTDSHRVKVTPQKRYESLQTLTVFVEKPFHKHRSHHLYFFALILEHLKASGGLNFML